MFRAGMLMSRKSLGHLAIADENNDWNGEVTVTNEGLTIAGTTTSSFNNIAATVVALTSGKYIFCSEPDAVTEGEATVWLGNNDGMVTKPAGAPSATDFWSGTFTSTSNLKEIGEGAIGNHTVSPDSATPDLLLCCFDIDASKIWFGMYDDSAGVTKWCDGGVTFTGDPAAGTNETNTINGTDFTAGFSTRAARGGDIDFGQSNLLSKITIPSGFGFIRAS